MDHRNDEGWSPDWVALGPGRTVDEPLREARWALEAEPPSGLERDVWYPVFRGPFDPPPLAPGKICPRDALWLLVPPERSEKVVALLKAAVETRLLVAD